MKKGFPVNPDVVLAAVGYVRAAPTCATCQHHKQNEDLMSDRSWIEHCYQFGTLGPIKIELGGICVNHKAIGEKS